MANDGHYYYGNISTSYEYGEMCLFLFSTIVIGVTSH
ncbi:Uncharacterised protein [Chlamydia abortus]|nr:Uncharacterised protein [Chlamydia abortus]